MKITAFLDQLQETLELEEVELTEETDLNSLEEYDSLAALSIIALVDETFAKKLTGDQLASITTVRSLMELIGMEHFEP